MCVLASFSRQAEEFFSFTCLFFCAFFLLLWDEYSKDKDIHKDFQYLG